MKSEEREMKGEIIKKEKNMEDIIKKKVDEKDIEID